MTPKEECKEFDKHFYMVEIAARRAHRRACMCEYDDAIQDGSIGLLLAIRASTNEVTSKGYYSIRIKGEIYDSMRRREWKSRDLIKNMQRINEVRLKLMNQLHKPVANRELASELNISIGQLETMLLIIGEEKGKELDNQDSLFQIPSFVPGPFDALCESEDYLEIKRCIERLSDQQQKVFVFYIFHGLKLREIGYILGVSESRCSRVLKSAVTQLKLEAEGKNEPEQN